MEDSEDFSSLSLDQRLDHKSWKARVSAYEEILGLIKKDEQFDLNILSKIVKDQNLIALETGLLVLLETFKNYNGAAARLDDCLGVLVEKCLGSTRSTTKVRAQEILLVYVELGMIDRVLVLLQNATAHRTPKVAVAAISTMTLILSSFGNGIMQLKPIVKILPKCFDHKDKLVREEATNLTLEIYKWVGPPFLSSLSDLKPVQLKDINNAIAELPSTKPVPTRYLRGQEPKFVVEEEVDEGAETEVNEHQQTADPEVFDFADPVAFIEKIPKSFYTDILTLNSTKWKERKEALEALLKLVDHPKLEDGKYFELINILAKVIIVLMQKIQDPNVVVLVLAANVLEKLGLGLKPSFYQYKGIIFHPLMERMKEKKPNVISALGKALDALFASIGKLADIVEEVFPFLGHSNPSVKIESMEFLVRSMALKKVSKELPKPLSSKLGELLVQAMNDSTSTVRDAAAKGLAQYMASFGEKVANQFVERLDKVKAAKVMEVYGILKAPSGNVSVAKSAPASAPLSRATSGSMSKSNSLSSVAASRPASPKVKPKVSQPLAKVKEPSRQNSQASLESNQAIQVKYRHSDDSAIDYVCAKFGESDLSTFKDANWKNRLEAMNNFAANLSAASDIEAEAVIRYLLAVLGWKENNFQVMTGMLRVFETLAKPELGFDAACVQLLAKGLADKLSDLKVKKISSSCLDACVVCSTLEFVFSEIKDTVNGMKSPKLIADALLWLNQAIREFGIDGLNLKNFVVFITRHLENPSPLVRNAAIALIVSAKMLGRDIRDEFSSLSSTIVSSIEVELGKVSGEVVLPSKPQKITDGLFEQLGHGDWKERKLGLETLSSLLASTKYSIQPSLDSEIVTMVKNRIGDSNRNLAVIAVDICGDLAKSMGKPFERYSRIFLGPLLALLSDQKVTVRSKVLSNLDKISKAIGLAQVLPSICTVLIQDQPQIRKDLLKWTIDNESELKSVDFDFDSALKPIFICLQDRNSEVRKLAQSFLNLTALHLTPATIKQKAADLFYGAQYASLVPFIDSVEDSSPVVETSSPKAVRKSPIPKSRVENLIKAKSSSKLSGKGSLLSLKLESSSSETLNNDSAEPLTFDPKGKDSRALADRGVSKWAFEVPRRDLIELLNEQCRNHFSSELHSLLFSNDHYKEKDILNGIKVLDGYLCSATVDPQSLQEVVKSSSDLILKYLTIRFFDTNTSIFIKCLDLLEHLLTILDEASYFLTEYEANAFLPFFVGKLGDPKESMRVKLRLILKQLGRVYPVSKLFQFLLKGLDSKNSRTKVECLDEIASLIQRNGLNVLVPAKAIFPIASQVGNRDPPVRNSALNAVCEIYFTLEDEMYAYLTKLSDKDRDLISERLRRLPPKKALPIKNVFVAPQKQLPMPMLDAAAQEQPGSTKSVRRKEFTLDLEQFDFTDHSIGKSNDKVKVFDQFTFTSQLQAVKAIDLADSQFDSVIAQMAGFDVEKRLEAAKALEKMLMSDSENVFVQSRDLVGILTPLSNTAFTTVSATNPLTLKLCKHITTVLIQLFASKESALYVPYDSLEECIRKVLLRLVDSDLQAIDASKTIPRALNMLMVRIIDNCQPNLTFKALLVILRESAMKQLILDEGERQIQTKYTELVMKCLWKITKAIPACLQTGSLKPDHLLVEIDNFLVEAPPQYWKRKALEFNDPQVDMPLRTVKTILHELVNYLGEDVLTYCSSFADRSFSATLNYLKQMLASISKKKELSKSTSPAAEDKMLPNLDLKRIQSILEEIFAQIADKSVTKTGLQRLYKLQKEHPEAKSAIDDRMNASGSYFQGYIKRGLEALALESQSRQSDDLSSDGVEYDTPIEVSDMDYGRTLQRLQKRFNNVDASPVKSVVPPPKAEVVEDFQVTRIPKGPVEASRETRSLAVKELKERLARMKMSMNS